MWRKTKLQVHCDNLDKITTYKTVVQSKRRIYFSKQIAKNSETLGSCPQPLIRFCVKHLIQASALKCEEFASFIINKVTSKRATIANTSIYFDNESIPQAPKVSNTSKCLMKVYHGNIAINVILFWRMLYSYLWNQNTTAGKIDT